MSIIACVHACVFQITEHNFCKMFFADCQAYTGANVEVYPEGNITYGGSASVTCQTGYVFPGGSTAPVTINCGDNEAYDSTPSCVIGLFYAYYLCCFILCYLSSCSYIVERRIFQILLLVMSFDLIYARQAINSHKQPNHLCIRNMYFSCCPSYEH